MAEKSERAQKEEKILQFWKEKKIFEKSLEKEAPKGEFVFYDGPPFATGLLHYGHILPGTVKDVIPRYKTMRGYRVPRRWGWDCHGLPIENLIEQELGLKTKKDIEKFGIAEFNKRARDSVLRYEKDWKEIIPRTGRWVDMDNAYKTMDSSFTESVWWSFKNLFDKGLIYTGFKSMHLCPRCETTLSNFEVNLNYKDIADISVYVKFELIDEPDTYFLAWTTTPWTLPGNVALAVNSALEYVKVKMGNEFLILAQERLSALKENPYEKVGSFKGSELVGKKYKTLFDYYFKEGQIYAADFVSAEEGTGIVHIAPAFGEEDYNLSLKEKLPFIQHVGTDGRFKPEVKDFAGLQVKPKDDHQSTDIEIIKYLAAKNLLFAKEKIIHSYPHCWRCDTPLLNYASSSWFVKVTEIKDKLVANNAKVKWVPDDIREGRFGKWLEGARDWAVSRSRYWGTPLPVWQNADGSKKLIIDSVDVLKKHIKANGNQYFIMRHGEALYNAKHLLDPQGDPNNHLTEQGKQEAIAASQELKSQKIDLIFASPFLRTRETAEIVRQELGLPSERLVIDERLHEFNESDEHPVYKRMGEFIFEAESRYKEKNILIIAHGNPLWVLEHLAVSPPSDKFTEREMLETAEVHELPFVPFPHNENYELDLHRPYIDEIVLEKDGEEYRRVPEVFDTWYDSGSVPFASRAARDFRPADFIAEGLDQTRGWFYTLIVLSTALFGSSPYKQVVVNGLVLAEDGKKMSKRLKNYPELTDVLDKYGADALRYYLISSAAVRAEDLAFSEKGLDEAVKKIINRVDNVISFYELYSGGERSGLENSKRPDLREPGHILDRWIDARLAQLIKEVTDNLESYELDRASRPIALFVDDLSTWYLRRSRTRPEALLKLRQVLIEFAKVLAPFMPFLAEDIYQRLKSDGVSESVHLERWPEAEESLFGFFKSSNKKVLWDMELTRKVASEVLMARNTAGIKVRQPLQLLKIQDERLKDKKEFIELIKDEVNVKEIVFDKGMTSGFWLDTTITPELKSEGELREEIRNIQDMRKNKGLKPGEKMKLKIPDEKRELYHKYKTAIELGTNVELE